MERGTALAWSDEDLGVLILIRMRAEASEMGNIAKLQKIAHEMKKKRRVKCQSPLTRKSQEAESGKETESMKEPGKAQTGKEDWQVSLINVK